MKSYDFAVVGAGVFGAWTAYFLRKSGASVILLDAHGPANSRASSGGETRVIRMGYGPDELYTRWAMQSLPQWRELSTRIGKEIFLQTYADLPYALPDVEGRGFKIAFDRHGERFDPDSGMRVLPQSSVDHLRAYLRQYVPTLADAPVIETRVCQYENTSNGDFLIDRHPDFENVWIAGGGSGHGFKHGPALGEYLSARILYGTPAEPRFSLAAKETAQKRAIY